MSELIPPPAWMADGVCAQADPEAWFPEKGASTRPAKAICNGVEGDDNTPYRAPCPVRDQCRAWGLETRQPYGVFGGLSEYERRKLLQAQRAQEVSDAA